jgi:hypothetical protein
MNSRLEACLQPIHKRSDEFLWIRAFAALPVSNELTEAFGDRRWLSAKVVETLGDENPRMSSVLCSILRSTMEQRGTVLCPDVVVCNVVDVVLTRFAPRSVEPRLLVLESGVIVVGIEIQDFRHLHSIN